MLYEVITPFRMLWEQPVKFHTIFEFETKTHNMKKLVILTISFLLMLNSCHQASKTQKEDSSSYNWNNAQSYISDDERFEFIV